MAALLLATALPVSTADAADGGVRFSFTIEDGVLMHFFAPTWAWINVSSDYARRGGYLTYDANADNTQGLILSSGYAWGDANDGRIAVTANGASYDVNAPKTGNQGAFSSGWLGGASPGWTSTALLGMEGDAVVQVEAGPGFELYWVSHDVHLVDQDSAEAPLAFHAKSPRAGVHVQPDNLWRRSAPDATVWSFCAKTLDGNNMPQLAVDSEGTSCYRFGEEVHEEVTVAFADASVEHPVVNEGFAFVAFEPENPVAPTFANEPWPTAQDPPCDPGFLLWLGDYTVPRIDGTTWYQPTSSADVAIPWVALGQDTHRYYLGNTEGPLGCSLGLIDEEYPSGRWCGDEAPDGDHSIWVPGTTGGLSGTRGESVPIVGGTLFYPTYDQDGQTYTLHLDRENAETEGGCEAQMTHGVESEEASTCLDCPATWLAALDALQ